MKQCVLGFSGFLLACLLAFSIQVFLFSPISPDLLELPPPSGIPTNKRLQEVIKLGEGLLEGPEDVVVDRHGMLYTAVRDGWIKRMHRNGTWESWKKVDSNGLLGITIAKEGGLIVCDAETGLLKVEEDGIRVLASHANGTKIRFADEVIESSDGRLYFTIPSTKFQFREWHLDILEGKPHGQLLKYDPSSNETTIVLEGLGFANGVALSREEDYLVVCETWKFRCMKLWLKGESKGQTETFVENLPGGPDNIYLAPDGSFWIAVLTLVSEGLEFVHTSRLLKYVLASFPNLARRFINVEGKGAVVNVAADGKIIRKFDDPEGKVMSFVTTAIEFDGFLYLGSLNADFIGKLPLTTAR